MARSLCVDWKKIKCKLLPLRQADEARLGAPLDNPRELLSGLAVPTASVQIIYRASEALGQHVVHSLTYPDAAVLDLHFLPHSPVPDERYERHLMVADSMGGITHVKLGTQNFINSNSSVNTSPQMDVMPIANVNSGTEPQRQLALFCTPDRTGTRYLATSDNGAVHQFSGQGPVSEQVHSLEAWIAVYSPSSKLIYSGGDDCALACLSAAEASETPESTAISTASEAQDESDAPPSRLLWKDTRIHTAGVTYILPLTETLLLTGSYDDHLRVISCVHPGRKRVLAEENLGGGVWRLKFLSHDPMTVLEQNDTGTEWKGVLVASCMYAGARVVEILRDEQGEWNISVLGKFEEHKSMCYGSDVQPLKEGEEAEERSIVSTSFYDKLVCLWKWKDSDEG